MLISVGRQKKTDEGRGRVAADYSVASTLLEG